MREDYIAKYQETINKSKFIAYLFEISHLDECRNISKELQKKHSKASHICFAGIFEKEFLIKNDGEVGQPAQKIANILQFNGYDKHVLCCVRYFGGVKLGVGGVGKAFKTVSQKCICEK